MITVEQLKKIMPQAGDKAALFVDHLNKAMEEFEINTPLRQAAFIAQLAHESAQFRYVRELASGSAYEGRKDLGNTQPGDGRKFRGRGLIQVTGRHNYTAVMMALDLDCLEHPELLETPENACKVSAWWWKDHDLSELADTGDFKKITRIINGGWNGLEEREAFYKKAKEVLLKGAHD